MSNVPEAVLRDISQVGRDLYQHGLVTSHGGNISVRDGDGMWITLTGARLGYLDREQVTYVSSSGATLGPPPSSDTVLHATGVCDLGGDLGRARAPTARGGDDVRRQRLRPAGLRGAARTCRMCRSWTTTSGRQRASRTGCGAGSS
ncbi:MAG: class II aldolase/adducin family protein [Dehalococcoidia bacterium]|nr:class II aldolase/adducin family protein [Dehalococcoidia bacterium]